MHQNALLDETSLAYEARTDGNGFTAQKEQQACNLKVLELILPVALSPIVL